MTGPLLGSVSIQRNILDCPLCCESFRGKVWQCAEGHVLCDKCRSQLPEPKKCPSCRKMLGSIRNRVLEDLSKDAPLPCRNEPRGCNIILPLAKRMHHEEECKYALFRCPHPDFGADCKWMGEAKQVVKHIEEMHCSVYTFKEVNSGDERDQWVTGRGPWISQNNVAGRSFLVYKYKKNGRFLVGVHHIGHGSPGKFRIRVELRGNAERIHQGPINSLRAAPKELSWFSVDCEQLDLDEEQKIHFFITIEV